MVRHGRRRSPDQRRTASLLLPMVGFLAAVYLLPVVRLIQISLAGSSGLVAPYVDFFVTPGNLTILTNTVWMAVVATLGCLLLGYPLAFYLTEAPPQTRRTLLLLVVLPFVTSILIRGYGWMVILGRHGVLNGSLQSLGLLGAPLKLLNTTVAAAVGMIHALLPLMVLSLFSVMLGIDRSLLKAASNLGASRRQAFWTVFVPLSIPGVAAGCLLVFVSALGFYITPALLGGPPDVMVAMLIESQVNELLQWNRAAATATVLLTAIVLLLLVLGPVAGFDEIWRGVSGQRGDTAGGRRLALSRITLRLMGLLTRAAGRLTPAARNDEPAVPAARVAGTAWNLALSTGYRVMTFGSLAFLWFPLLVIFTQSFSAASYLTFPPPGFSLRWFAKVASDPAWLVATQNSLIVALGTTLVSVGLGSLGAVGLTRGDGRIQGLILPFLVSPLIIPEIITAIALYFALARVPFVSPLTALVLGHSIRGTVIAVVILSAALQNVDRSVENAATNLGANRARVLRYVTFPLIVGGLVSAGMFVFLYSFDELIFPLFFSGVGSATLPKKIWEEIRFQIEPTIAAVSTIVVAITIVLLLCGRFLSHLLTRSRSTVTTVN